MAGAIDAVERAGENTQHPFPCHPERSRGIRSSYGSATRGTDPSTSLRSAQDDRYRMRKSGAVGDSWIVPTSSRQGAVLCLVPIFWGKGTIFLSPPSYPVDLKKQDREPSPVLWAVRSWGRFWTQLRSLSYVIYCIREYITPSGRVSHPGVRISESDIGPSRTRR